MKTAVLVIISIIFIPLFLFIILFTSIDNTILNPELINSKLEKANAYHIIATEVLPNTISQLFSSASNSVAQNQIVDNIKNEITDKIDQSWVKQQLNDVYNKSVNYIKDKTQDKNISIDLKPISNIFSKENLSNIAYTDTYIKEQYELLPICTQENKDDLCREESLTLEQFEKAFKDEIDKSENPFEEIFPDKFNIYELLNDSSKKNILDSLERIYLAFRSTYYIFLVVNVLILVTIIALLYKERKRMFKYLGIIFIIPSIPVFIFSLLFYFLYAGFLSNVFLAMQIPESSALLAVSIIGSIFNSFIFWLIVISFISLVLSITFLILSKKNNNISNNKEE